MKPNGFWGTSFAGGHALSSLQSEEEMEEELMEEEEEEEEEGSPLEGIVSRQTLNTKWALRFRISFATAGPPQQPPVPQEGDGPPQQPDRRGEEGPAQAQRTHLGGEEGGQAQA